MGPLLQTYVVLSALSFKFVSACQDGKFTSFLKILFFFSIVIILIAFLLVIEVVYFLCFSFNFLQEKTISLSSS